MACLDQRLASLLKQVDFRVKGTFIEVAAPRTGTVRASSVPPRNQFADEQTMVFNIPEGKAVRCLSEASTDALSQTTHDDMSSAGSDLDIVARVYAECIQSEVTGGVTLLLYGLPTQCKVGDVVALLKEHGLEAACDYVYVPGHSYGAKVPKGPRKGFAFVHAHTEDAATVMRTALPGYSLTPSKCQGVTANLKQFKRWSHAEVLVRCQGALQCVRLTSLREVANAKGMNKHGEDLSAREAPRSGVKRSRRTRRRHAASAAPQPVFVPVCFTPMGYAPMWC